MKLSACKGVIEARWPRQIGLETWHRSRRHGPSRISLAMKRKIRKFVSWGFFMPIARAAAETGFRAGPASDCPENGSTPSRQVVLKAARCR